MLLEAVVECENTVMRILELSVDRVVGEEESDIKITKIATFLMIRFLWKRKFRKFEKDVGNFKSGGSVVKWKDNNIRCEVIGWRKYGDTKLWYEDRSC